MGNLKMIELFAGIRAFSLASEWIGGFETVEAVEINPYCNEKMYKRYPHVPSYGDITTYHPKLSVDVIVEGSDDPRSGLIKEFLRVCDESRPKFIILENVRGIHSSGELQAFCECLHRGGYNFDAEIIKASEVGAPHQRERIFVVAYSHSIVKAAKCKILQSWAEQIRYQIAIARTFGRWESTQLPDNGVSHGVPNRLAGLSAYGNAIVPQCAVVPLLRVKYLAGLAE